MLELQKQKHSILAWYFLHHPIEEVRHLWPSSAYIAK